MSNGISPTSHRADNAATPMAPQSRKEDLPPELLVVPYSMLTIITAYYSYKRAAIFVWSMPKFFEVYQLPKASNPQVCSMLKTLRNQALKMTAADVVTAVAFAYMLPVPVYSRTIGIVAALDGVLTLAITFLEPKYCDNPNGKPKHDEEGNAVLEQLQAIVNGWRPQTAGGFGRSANAAKKVDWRPSSEGDFVESDGVGTVMTFFAVLGGMAAVSAASGLSWTAESIMGATSRVPVPAFGY